MTRDVLNITADVLEKAAAYIDAVESEKIEAVAAERSKIASALKNRYEEATGESLEDSFLSKLAASDTDIIKFVEKLAGSTQAPESMGGPGESRGEMAEPRTKKEAAVAAEDRFAAWLTS